MAEPAIVRKVGEGVDRPTAEWELPIDVNYQKLTDFLVARQKLPKDWHKRLQAINAKANAALKEAPAEALSKLPGGADGAPMDYARAVQLRDVFAATTDRGLFGGLTGHAGTWDKIVKAYENQAVFLGESAQMLVQNADYEIPFLRKQAQRCDAQVTDCQRRHAEYVRSAGQCAANFKAECERLGVDPTDVRGSLRGLAKELPQNLEKVADAVQTDKLGEAVAYYKAFSRYAHGTPDAEEMLPTLAEVREERTAPPANSASASGNGGEAAAPALNIDWGIDLGTGGVDGGSGGDAPAGIDWDMDLGGGGGAGGSAADGADGGDGATAEISWDIDLSAAAADAAAASEQPVASASASGSSKAVEVEWGIDLAGEGADVAAPALDIDWDIGAGSAGATDAAAQPASDSGAAAASTTGRGALLARLECDSDYRAHLLDNLQELRAFLHQRKAEMDAAAGELLGAQLPGDVQSVDTLVLAHLLRAADAAVAAACDARLRQVRVCMSV